MEITLNITCCESCPYLEYDPYYDRSSDSGYDCKLDGRRIVDDYKLQKYFEEHDEWKKISKMFPSEEPPKNPLGVIPDWCPLQNKE